MAVDRLPLVDESGSGKAQAHQDEVFYLQKYLTLRKKLHANRWYLAIAASSTLLLFALFVYVLGLAIAGAHPRWERTRFEGQLSKAHAEMRTHLEANHFEAGEDARQFVDDFVRFAHEHGKEYDDMAESMQRFKTYIDNRKEIDRLNGDAANFGSNVVFGDNHMSDWTEDEFKSILLPVGSKTSKRERNFVEPLPESFQRESAIPLPGGIPGHYDWRPKGVVTPARAQEKCGSCWAFAATATVESAFAIAHGELRNLSEQTLLDCDLSNDACDGGDDDKAFRFVHRHGLALRAEYPYVAHRQNGCIADVEHLNTTKIKAAYLLNPDERTIRDWLVNFGPVNVGMSVIQPMRSYKGGVFYPSKEACEKEVIGLHALLVVGYGTSDEGEPYWIIKNSWGYDYGVEHGYIYYRRGVNACGIEDEPIGLLA